MSNDNTRSFVDAISERYGAEDDTAAYAPEAFLVGSTAANPRLRNKTWEMVGMDTAREKVSQLNKIRVLGLQNCGIRTAEKVNGQISKLRLDRVRELDLSDNKDLQATEVDAIVAALSKSLVELQLSGTDLGNVSSWSSPAQSDLSRPSSAAAAAGGAVAAADTKEADDSTNINADEGTSAAAAAASSSSRPVAELNKMHLNSVQSLASSCSELSSSSIPSSPFRSDGWSRIKTLAINRCGISWASIVGAFPSILTSLTSLHCESNGIDKICGLPPVAAAPSPSASSPSASTSSFTPQPPAAAAPGPMFPTLTELNLSFNSISCSLDDAEMNLFFCNETPNLISLNLTGNNVFAPAWASASSAAAEESKQEEKRDERCYLGRLQNLYIAGNKEMVVKHNKKSMNNLSGEEPLQALEWIRAACPSLKALRVAYDDFFGIPPVAATTNSSNNNDENQSQLVQRPLCNLSEVQQRSLVIASIGQVEMLNSGTVRAKERLDAEMLYLQVAKAKQKQQQQQQQLEDAAAAAAKKEEEDTDASAAAAAAAAVAPVVSATQRFFPWTVCPRLAFLEEKHKGVVLSCLGGSQQQQVASNSMSAALNYTLQLTFRVLSKDADAAAAEQQEGGGADVAEIEGTSRSQRRERVKKTNVTALAQDITRTVPGNMTVGKLRSFVASVFPALAPVSKQKKLQAYPRETTIPPTVLAAVDDEQPLVLCGVPSSAVVEVFV